MAGSELLAMMLADARLPVGAHTQSAGLEPALAAGMPVAVLPELIRTRLRTVVLVEAATAVLARRRCDDQRWLHRVDQAWRARTASEALRDNADQLGRGYLRLIRRLWPEYPGVRALAVMPRPTRAVVLGVAAAAAGLDDAQLARLVGYDDAQTVTAAALKIAPMDPLDAAAWFRDVVPDIEDMVRSATAVTDLDDLPAAAAPLVEHWAQSHAVATQRLFRA